MSSSSSISPSSSSSLSLSFHLDLFATTVVVSVAALALTVSAAVTWSYANVAHQRRLRELERQWQQRRQEERTGRIRAEIKLRTLSKQQQQQQNKGGSDKDNSGSSNSHNGSMMVTPIGHVVSPFTKRMGTPRQSQLVPSARGYIQLDRHSTICPPQCLDGIQHYSHLWIVFHFHANTNATDATTTTNGTTTKRAKIRPPRAPAGTKVGVLATRSPHRPNPLGLSLVQFARWDAAARQLHVTGLDLVHGTPVWDIKPCVPWDVPGYYEQRQAKKRRPTQAALNNNCNNSLKVPFWVDQDDEITTVILTDTAQQQLREAVAEGRLQPLYTLENDGIEAARATLCQILAQDPRSSHKGLKQNKRGTTISTKTAPAANTVKKDAVYSIIFGQCQVDFVVLATTTTTIRNDNDSTKASGTAVRIDPNNVPLEEEEARVEVVAISPVVFDPSSYVDGIPIVTAGVVVVDDVADGVVDDDDDDDNDGGGCDIVVGQAVATKQNADMATA